MGLDEAGTPRILREHRAVTDAVMAKHGGRIVKTTGDGLLIEFPSVVDAIECAVFVQKGMAKHLHGSALGPGYRRGDGSASTWRSSRSITRAERRETAADQGGR